MKQPDIRLLLGQIMAGIARSDEPPQRHSSTEALNAHNAESDRIDKNAREAALDLAASSLCAIHRLADAQERIAHVLESGGPFALMAEAKALFGQAPHIGDQG